MKKRIAVLALAALMAASFSTAALAAPAPAPGLWWCSRPLPGPP